MWLNVSRKLISHLYWTIAVRTPVSDILRANTQIITQSFARIKAKYRMILIDFMKICSSYTFVPGVTAARLVEQSPTNSRVGGSFSWPHVVSGQDTEPWSQGAACLQQFPQHQFLLFLLHLSIRFFTFLLYFFVFLCLFCHISHIYPLTMVLISNTTLKKSYRLLPWAYNFVK